jgi:hypothetical protein
MAQCPVSHETVATWQSGERVAVARSTERAFRTRSETRELVAGTVNALALSRQLIVEVDSALAMHREVLIRSDNTGWLAAPMPRG